MVASTIAPPGAVAIPLAAALTSLLPSEFPSVTAARKACRRGEVLLNGTPARQDAPVAQGDAVAWAPRLGGACAPAAATALATAAASIITVAYEDDYMAVIVKPAGVATLGAGPGGADVASALPSLLLPTPLPGALWRPRPVHRPDTDTGGVLLVAKTRPVLAALTRAVGGA